MQVLRAAGYYAVPDGEPNQFREHARCAHMSVGTYCIPVGGKDAQEPHTEDEVYVVMRGRATLVTDTREVQVGPGSVIFLPAGEAHHYADVTEDLSVVVVFGPAQHSRA